MEPGLGNIGFLMSYLILSAKEYKIAEILDKIMESNVLTKEEIQGLLLFIRNERLKL